MGDASVGAWIVVPAFGRPETTRRALRSLFSDGDHRVILVDDEGRGYGDEIGEEFPGIDVLQTEAPVFWTGAIRLGAERALAAGATGVLLFNQDVTVEPGFLGRLEETRARFPGAVIGCSVVYAHERETVWSAGARMEWFGRGFRMLFHGKPVEELPAEPYPVDWVHGMGTWVPAEAFRRIGLPDADRFPMAWGDAEFGLRARAAGIPVVVDPRLRLVHDVGDYDARVAGAPTFREYLSWLASDRHNLSLSAQLEIWRRHGPRGLWPVSFALRVGFLLANYVRIRLRFGRRTALS
jgi:GT2 family glycosyltransferase